MRVRRASAADAEPLAALLADYLAESFPGHPGTDAATLERDVLPEGGGVQVLLAEVQGKPIGFVTWHRVYDLHWAKGGAEIGDLYVAPAHRGVGAALAMVAAVCSEALGRGLSYLRGGSFDRSSPVGHLYERIAVAHDSAECHCAGRAFRRLAELAGQSPRAMLGGLPPKEWNYQP
jgi:GNAT superfamily N-acetyltransferase